MKKYWKIIVIAAVIIFGIGTFYVNAAMSASQNPAYEIKKISGNEKEINPVVITGEYQQSPVNFERLWITSEGSSYQGEQSFFERMKGNRSLEVKRMQKDYRNFMRGKNTWETAFYEDKQYLVSADVTYTENSVTANFIKLNSEFEISVLDKKTNDTTNFQIPVPKGGDYSHVLVTDVQMVNEKLEIITKNQPEHKGEINPEIHVYGFDVQAKKVIDDETIIEEPNQEENTHVEIGMISESSSTTKHPYVFFEKVVYEVTETGDGYNTEKVKEKAFFSYHLETKTVEVIKLPESVDKSYTAATFNDSRLYLTKFVEEGFVITPYNTESKKLEDNIEVKLENGKEWERLLPAKMNDGKLYVVMSHVNWEKPARLVVADLNSGDMLFEGEIVQKDPAVKHDKNYYFDLYDLEIK